MSGWLISLPLTSAPVIFILALERGDAFAAEASIGVILGLISQSAFSLIYCQLLLRSKLQWYVSLPIGWSVFLASTLLLKGVQLTIWIAFLSFTIAFVFAVRNIPEITGYDPPDSSNTSGWDIPARMLAAATLVLLITESATILGPMLSGLLTPFPVYISVLAASEHRSRGAKGAAQLVRGATIGFFTPAFFFLVVGSVLSVLELGFSFGVAILLSLFVHRMLLRII